LGTGEDEEVDSSFGPDVFDGDGIGVVAEDGGSMGLGCRIGDVSGESVSPGFSARARRDVQ
jgi:hypothetical protein